MSPSVVLGAKRCISKSYSHFGKGSNTQKCWKTKAFVGAEGFFRRTAGSLTVQDKQGTHEQPSLNKQVLNAT